MKQSEILAPNSPVEDVDIAESIHVLAKDIGAKTVKDLVSIEMPLVVAALDGMGWYEALGTMETLTDLRNMCARY